MNESLTFHQKASRIERCRQKGLCFISLRPLDAKDKLVRYSLDGAWLENVQVKAQYAPTGA